MLIFWHLTVCREEVLPVKFRRWKSQLIIGINKNGEIYNGADDNASGVATLLEVAELCYLVGTAIAGN